MTFAPALRPSVSLALVLGLLALAPTARASDDAGADAGTHDGGDAGSKDAASDGDAGADAKAATDGSSGDATKTDAAKADATSADGDAPATPDASGDASSDAPADASRDAPDAGSLDAPSTDARSRDDGGDGGDGGDAGDAATDAPADDSGPKEEAAVEAGPIAYDGARVTGDAANDDVPPPSGTGGSGCSTTPNRSDTDPLWLFAGLGAVALAVASRRRR